MKKNTLKIRLYRSRFSYRFPRSISSKGFSLIELLVSFTLIAVITGMGFVSFVTYSRSQIITQSGANIKQNIELARSNATSSVKPAICGEDALSAYRINFCHNSNCYSTNPGTHYEMTVVCGSVEQSLPDRDYSLPDNVSFENEQGGTNCDTITFNVISGVIEGTPCQVTIEGYGNEKVISIDPQGHVSY